MGTLANYAVPNKISQVILSGSGVVVGALLIVTPIVGVLCLFHVLMGSLLDGEDRAGCFALFSWCLVTIIVMWLFLTVQWLCLKCVIVGAVLMARHVIDFGI